MFFHTNQSLIKEYIEQNFRLYLWFEEDKESNTMLTLSNFYEEILLWLVFYPVMFSDISVFLIFLISLIFSIFSISFGRFLILIERLLLLHGFPFNFTQFIVSFGWSLRKINLNKIITVNPSISINWTFSGKKSWKMDICRWNNFFCQLGVIDNIINILTKIIIILSQIKHVQHWAHWEPNYKRLKFQKIDLGELCPMLDMFNLWKNNNNFC